MSVAQKRKEKKFSEFTSDDWKEIGVDSGKGTIKGGIRGGAIYVLTNFTATPANVASAYVTAAFGLSLIHIYVHDDENLDHTHGAELLGKCSAQDGAGEGNKLG